MYYYVKSNKLYIIEFSLEVYIPILLVCLIHVPYQTIKLEWYGHPRTWDSNFLNEDQKNKHALIVMCVSNAMQSWISYFGETNIQAKYWFLGFKQSYREEF